MSTSYLRAHARVAFGSSPSARSPARSASLTSTISPLTGMNRSAAALTDSTTPATSPFLNVLPTAGTARFSSPLGVYDFQKRSSLIEVSEAGAQKLGPIAAELAYGEGLQAHARAAEMRLKKA